MVTTSNFLFVCLFLQYCKLSKTGAREGLGRRLGYKYIIILIFAYTTISGICSNRVGSCPCTLMSNELMVPLHVSKRKV